MGQSNVGRVIELRYCADDPEADIERLETVDCDPSIAAWAEDRQSSDALLSASDLDAVAPGNGLTVAMERPEAAW